MNKLKSFYKKNEKTLLFIGGVLSAIVIGGVWVKIRKTCELQNRITINPVYYPTLDEAVDAFKELAKTTKYPVICGDGCNNEWFGVFDETSVIK